ILSEPNCIILVAGETSAEKSSFLNLLMERDVLSTSHLAATSTIYLIHPIEPESTRYFKVHLNGKKPKKYIVSKQNENEMLTKLKKMLVCREERYRNARVDIYRQVPLLDYNYHATLVDTPGIGESKEMSESVYEYLTNASAFIFIINSAYAGGVQKDNVI
ncbi:hypothetical protein DPMN_041487, partial [Dreissena polymorpha]